MKIKETDEELILTEIPVMAWLACLFAAAIGGVLLYTGSGGMSGSEKLVGWQIALLFIMGGFAFLVGTFYLSTLPITKVIINKKHKIISIKKYGLFGKLEEVYKLSDVKEFSLIAEKDSDGDSFFPIVLSLKDGQEIKITSSGSHSEEYMNEFVFPANEYINKIKSFEDFKWKSFER